MEEESFVIQLLSISSHLALSSFDKWQIDRISELEDNLDEFQNFELPHIQRQFILAEKRVLLLINQNLEKVIANKLHSNIDLDKIKVDPDWGYTDPNSSTSDFKIRPNDHTEFKKQWLKLLIVKLTNIRDAINAIINLHEAASNQSPRNDKKQPKDHSKMNERELLLVDDAAKFLAISNSSLYSKARNGEIPSMKKGGRLYFFKQQLIDYVKSGSRKTNIEIEKEAETYLSKLKKGGQQ